MQKDLAKKLVSRIARWQRQERLRKRQVLPLPPSQPFAIAKEDR